MKKSKKSKKSITWKIKQHRDQFFKKSKTLGYRSRSAFKLIELNKKYKFIKNNTRLLDIYKPLGIKKLEQLPYGFGIMLDDIAAGILGAVILYIVYIII